MKRKRRSVTLVHKGNIQKFTEGAFRNWGYELAREEFSDVAVGWDDCGGNPGDKILVKDDIADITLQQVLTRPDEFDVIATTNLNGDYLSDALAAQVGGIGIAPGGNINYVTGHGVFEATHGTAPKYAGQDKVNPGSVILSGRDDVRAPRLAGRRRRHRPRTRSDHRRQDRDVRLRPPHGGRHRGQDVGVRGRHLRPALGSNPPSVILAELNIRHTRRHLPTRRVALGDHYLPTSGPAYGAVLLGAVVSENLGGLDDEQRDLLPRLLADAEDGLSVPRIALRYRLQTDTHGLDRSRHRIVADGGPLVLELDRTAGPRPRCSGR